MSALHPDIRDALLGDFLRREAPGVADCCRRAQALAKARGLPEPSMGQLRGFLNAFVASQPALAAWRRHGVRMERAEARGGACGSRSPVRGRAGTTRVRREAAAAS